MSDKEALERLKRVEAGEGLLDVYGYDDPDIKLRSDLAALIAEQEGLEEQADGERLLHISTEGQLQERIEGLEREVERLTWLAQKRFEHKVEARTRMEAAEAQLSALQEALKGIEAGRYENAPDDTLDHPARRIARQALALLLPTVPVEGS